MSRLIKPENSPYCGSKAAVAAYLNISVPAVNKMIMDGLPCMKLSDRRTLYRKEEVDEFILTYRVDEGKTNREAVANLFHKLRIAR